MLSPGALQLRGHQRRGPGHPMAFHRPAGTLASGLGASAQPVSLSSQTWRGWEPVFPFNLENSDSHHAQQPWSTCSPQSGKSEEVPAGFSWRPKRPGSHLPPQNAGLMSVKSTLQDPEEGPLLPDVFLGCPLPGAAGPLAGVCPPPTPVPAGPRPGNALPESDTVKPLAMPLHLATCYKVSGKTTQEAQLLVWIFLPVKLPLSCFRVCRRKKVENHSLDSDIERLNVIKGQNFP